VGKTLGGLGELGVRWFHAKTAKGAKLETEPRMDANLRMSGF